MTFRAWGVMLARSLKASVGPEPSRAVRGRGVSLSAGASTTTMVVQRRNTWQQGEAL
jgi:hypothetical protein